jgi:hypothetical protein
MIHDSLQNSEVDKSKKLLEWMAFINSLEKMWIRILYYMTNYHEWISTGVSRGMRRLHSDVLSEPIVILADDRFFRGDHTHRTSDLSRDVVFCSTFPKDATSSSSTIGFSKGIRNSRPEWLSPSVKNRSTSKSPIPIVHQSLTAHNRTVSVIDNLHVSSINHRLTKDDLFVNNIFCVWMLKLRFCYRVIKYRREYWESSSLHFLFTNLDDLQHEDFVCSRTQNWCICDCWLCWRRS